MMRLLQYQGIPLWRNVVFLQFALQIVSAVLVVSFLAFFFTNLLREIDQREIPFGFSFLDRSTGIPIGETLISYTPEDSYRYTLFVAFLNTVKVAFAGVVLATIVGIIVGVARLSPNWLLNRLALVYIDVFRNIPLLVQLLFWFFIVLALPPIREAYVLGDAFFLSNSGFAMPWVAPQGSFWPWVLVCALGLGVAFYTARVMERRETESGRASHSLLAFLVIAFGVGTAAFFAFGGPLDVTMPERGAFERLSGGTQVSGSFVALLIGLVVYTSSFIAEIVRAGIQSVSKGQTEAARSTGLNGTASLRFVIFPQALRVIIPPTISHYLNLTKNSSLAAAIGYPDMVGVATTLTQTAPAVSLIGIVMVSYLGLSLFYALVGNVYNRLIRYKAL